MKIVNLISIDIGSAAAASDVANNAAKTRLEFDLFDCFTLPPPFGIVIPFFALRPQSMAMFFAANKSTANEIITHRSVDSVIKSLSPISPRLARHAGVGGSGLHFSYTLHFEAAAST